MTLKVKVNFFCSRSSYFFCLPPLSPTLNSLRGGIHQDQSRFTTIDRFDLISLRGRIHESSTRFFFGVGFVNNQKDFSKVESSA